MESFASFVASLVALRYHGRIFFINTNHTETTGKESSLEVRRRLLVMSMSVLQRNLDTKRRQLSTSHPSMENSVSCDLNRNMELSCSCW